MMFLFQYGWYWGPISGDAAELLLNGECDGSFLVRDSSDDHYIFSLTFKLDGHVRHVRIEHDQGIDCFIHGKMRAITREGVFYPFIFCVCTR